MNRGQKVFRAGKIVVFFAGSGAHALSNSILSSAISAIDCFFFLDANFATFVVFHFTTVMFC